MNLKNSRIAGFVAVLAISAVGGLGSFAQADEIPQPPIRLEGLYNYFGVQGGINFSNISGDTAAPLSAHTGFQFGVHLEIPFTPTFSIMPVARFAERGASVNTVINGATLSGEETLKYFDVPVLAKFSYPSDSQLTPFFFIGPDFSFKTGTGGSLTIQGNGFQQSAAITANAIHEFDFGFDVGAGPQFQLNQTTRMFVDFEYYFGLTNVASDTNNKNRVPQINLGFSWAM